MIVLKGYIKVPRNELSKVISELPNHIALTKSESGCLQFSVIQRQCNETIFDVFEQFEDESSFELHQIRVNNSVWGQITKNVQRFYEVTKVDL